VAEGLNDEILDAAAGEEVTKARQVLYHNPSNHRLWMIGAFPDDYQKGNALKKVEITTTDDSQRIVSRLSADEAIWDRKTRIWHFTNPILGRFEPGMPPHFEESTGTLAIGDWSETPWQLIKPGLNASEIGIPDLTTWLRTNSNRSVSLNPLPYLTQWHYRWALPFASLVTVLLAAPLAIHFSRRGPGGGIFLAVVLSALMMLLSSIVIAFGEAGIMRPMLAAWLPNLTFGGLAIYLFHLRVTGRPIYETIRKALPGGGD
jgi:lipopolysaccharide export LptBFGC system permease protein LptF